MDVRRTLARGLGAAAVTGVLTLGAVGTASAETSPPSTTQGVQCVYYIRTLQAGKVVTVCGKYIIQSIWAHVDPPVAK